MGCFVGACPKTGSVLISQWFDVLKCQVKPLCDELISCTGYKGNSMGSSILPFDLVFLLARHSKRRTSSGWALEAVKSTSCAAGAVNWSCCPKWLKMRL